MAIGRAALFMAPGRSDTEGGSQARSTRTVEEAVQSTARSQTHTIRSNGFAKTRVTEGLLFEERGIPTKASAVQRNEEGVMGDEVVGGVVKVIELVGSSPSSFSDAVRNAVKVASQSIRHIQGVEVISSNASVTELGELENYKVHCKIAFLVEASTDVSGAAVSAASTSTAGARTVSPGARA